MFTMFTIKVFSVLAQLLLVTKQKVRLMGMSLFLQVFSHKPKYWTN